MPTIAESLAQGKAYHRAGQLPEALQSYQQVVQSDASHAEAHYLLGVACHALGKPNEAVTSLEQAVRLKADYAEAHHYLGFVLDELGDRDEALARLQQAQRLKPESAEISKNLQRALAVKDCQLASELAAQGKLDEAAACFRRALELRPDDSEAHNNFAAVLKDQNKLDEAAASCRRALELKPDNAGAHGNLAAVLEKQGQFAEAADCYRRILALKPNYAAAHNNLGVVLEQQGHLDEAAGCWRRALELQPDFAAAHNNLGAVLEQQNKLDEAAGCYRRAMELQPDFSEAHYNLGAIWEKLGKSPEAEACWRRVLELQSDFPEATGNLGTLLAQQGRVAEAGQCYREAMQQHPEQDVWKLSRLSLCPSVFNSNEDIEHFRRTLLGELKDFGNTEPSFDFHVLATAACMPSFNLQFQGRNDRPIREAYAKLFRNCFPGETPTGSAGRPRIGFVVTDRHEAIFLKSMAGVLEHIDQDLFDLVVVGSDRGVDLMRAAIRNPAVRLLGVRNKFDPFVEAIRAARFDLLYYWEVATDSTNYFLPFLRLAPVQCTSWGIQMTSGVPQLDHYISSELAETEDARSHYTENLVLAKTLLTYQRRVSIPDSPRPRESFGITPHQHVYLCAQQLGKFHPDFDPILAGILRRDAQGVVVVTENRHGSFIANQLRQRFAATIGDVAGRIVFLPYQLHADYLSLVAAADVLLDPLHFGGVNSSYDGFSLNKPIVTLPSQFQRGRYTLACYKKMGVFDCVASDPRQYIDIAVALGTDADFCDQVVEKIRRASPVLFEDMEAVREHERIFSALVEEARAAHRGDGM